MVINCFYVVFQNCYSIPAGWFSRHFFWMTREPEMTRPSWSPVPWRCSCRDAGAKWLGGDVGDGHRFAPPVGRCASLFEGYGIHQGCQGRFVFGLGWTKTANSCFKKCDDNGFLWCKAAMQDRNIALSHQKHTQYWRQENSFALSFWLFKVQFMVLENICKMLQVPTASLARFSHQHFQNRCITIARHGSRPRPRHLWTK